MRNPASLNPSVNINDASRRQITEEETFEREDYPNDIDEEILRDLMELEELEGIETVFRLGIVILLLMHKGSKKVHE